MPVVTLENRSLIRLSGPDGAHFLHNLVTTDIEGLPQGEAWPGALLTPQGKILFDFLVARDADGFMLETTTDQADALAKRLTMYKLRAKVDIVIDHQTGVSVGWQDTAPEGAVTDHRFALAGIHLWRLHGKTGENDAAQYHALRTSLGIAEGGSDYPFSDAFPHDVLFDKSGGVSFRKGCYVGQEVVSRMQHRATARRRVVIVSAESPLSAGAALMAGEREIGRLGSWSGQAALAIARIDKIGAALASGTPLEVDGTPVTVRLPDWSGLAFPAEAAEDEG